MLKFVMSETVTIKPGKDKRVPYDQRRNALRDAWSKRQPEIEDIYPIIE